MNDEIKSLYDPPGHWEKAVKSLVRKAEQSQNQDEAMKYSQAVLNLAHAIATLGNNERAK